MNETLYLKISKLQYPVLERSYGGREKFQEEINILKDFVLQVVLCNNTKILAAIVAQSRVMPRVRCLALPLLVCTEERFFKNSDSRLARCRGIEYSIGILIWRWIVVYSIHRFLELLA